MLVSLLAYLPLRVNRGIGAFFGWLTWVLKARARRFAAINVALAFPDMSADERATLVRRTLIGTGVTFTESVWSWRRSNKDIFSRMANEGMETAIRDTRRRKRGTLMATPHIGNWEASLLSVFCVPIEGEYLRIAYFYRPPRDTTFEPMMIKGRTALGGDPLRLDAGGIRSAIKRLRSGGIVGILPDQEPDRDGGVFAPFFGTPALTMTLMSRLARKSNADVMFAVTERTPTGWRNHAIKPHDSILDPDPVIAATAVNEAVERCVMIAPEQYLWSYRRYRELPEGGRRSY